MATRRVGSLGTAAVLIGAAAASSHPLAGQEQSAAPPLVVTAFGDKPAPPYSAPRTSWGDPDLQGVWSSDDTSGIPMQRPANLGNELYQSDEQWAARQKQTQQGIQNALNAIGTFRGDYARRSFRQTSLVVDPPNGRVPALVAGAEARRTPQGTYGNGPLDSAADFTLYDRCVTLGVVGSMTPKIYGNGYRIVQAPGYVVIMSEMIHEARVIPLNGRQHVGQGVRAYLGDSRGHWEGNRW